MMSEPGNYVLAKPTGEAETGRLDLQHRMWLVQHHGLYSAPLTPSPNQPFRVLDIGCGTGIWSLAFATEHPNSTVLGFDITLPQPKSVPPNCHFKTGDAEIDWKSFATATEPFDLIHARMLINSIRDWPLFLSRCLSHLRPSPSSNSGTGTNSTAGGSGGWLEINDVTHRFFASNPACSESQSPMLKWWRLVFQASSRANGIDLDGTYRHAEQMREVGFVDVRERVFTWPVGRWAGGKGGTMEEREIGELLQRNLPVLIDGVTGMAIEHGDLKGMKDGGKAMGMGMSAEETRALAVEAKRDVSGENAERWGYYMHFATYVGRAPPGKQS